MTLGQNQFAESLVEVMLSWMRWLTSWFWNIVNSEGISGGGFLQWFSNNWISLAIFLIIVGAIYLAVTFFLSKLVLAYERRLNSK